MSKIEKFEDLECWQLSRRLVSLIFDLISNESVAKEFALKDQLKRATISIMSNIAEGFGRYSNKEFIRFLDIASASTNETKSLLYIFRDRHLSDEQTIHQLMMTANEIQSKILALIKYLKTRGYSNSNKPV